MLARVFMRLLLAINAIDSTLYKVIDIARDNRNTLAHRAQINLKAAKECLAAMKATIEFLCTTTIEPPLVVEHLGW